MDINSSRFKVELDNYIIGGRFHKSTEEIRCKECDYLWEVVVCHEYGTSWFEPEEPKCPNCEIFYTEDEED